MTLRLKKFRDLATTATQTLQGKMRRVTLAAGAGFEQMGSSSEPSAMSIPRGSVPTTLRQVSKHNLKCSRSAECRPLLIV